MEVTLSGMVISLRDLQLSKAYSPMEVTLSGMIIFSMDEQSWKACALMDVNRFGIVIKVSSVRHIYSFCWIGKDTLFPAGQP